MKKAFVIGMVALATTVSFSTAHAAGVTGAKSVKESLVDYTKQIKEAAFGKGGTAKGLSAQQAQIARDKMINELNLPAGKNNALAMSLTSDSAKSSQRLENLATVIAAKKMAVEISKQDAVEGKSIDEAATASAKLLANASLTGARKSAKELDAAELADTSAALTKLEGLPEGILTRFSKAERDSYTKIIEKHDQLVETGAKSTSEEAFVQAIMDVKKVDKAKALEIVRKLKECV
ncbi:hypothetical protein [Bdellovibrio svalbardensis]|uniref:DUF4142 domain-containing protein n=1 Tax=Bdellovibrio svalbardensis TaxID=2972972 RepID=A0ABT6DDA7_9BACT|nr:hypothetical protein [Bdellovibrio svalbardensis]MDG0814797.1 hypothetical protein [Bdellovibrio svalbardensis]